MKIKISLDMDERQTIKSALSEALYDLEKRRESVQMGCPAYNTYTKKAEFLHRLINKIPLFAANA